MVSQTNEGSEMTTVLIQLFIFLGCINDVANIKDFLTTLYGFKEVNVHVQAMGGERRMSLFLTRFVGGYGHFDR